MSKINKLLKLSEKAIANGHFQEAIGNLDELLRISPDEIKYLMMRGEAFLRIENYEAGLIDYAKVVEADDRNITALVNFSVALIRTNNQNQAKNILEYVIELDSNNFDAHINLCNVYQTLGNSEECLKLSLKAIQIRPGASIAYNNLGTAFGDLNMIEEARDALVIANQIDPTFIPTVINLAQIQIKLNNYNEGARLYEETLRMKNVSPSEGELIKYYLSYAYLHLGDLSKGWDFYEYGFGSLLPISAFRSKRKFVQPQWNGEPIGSKTLLIWREQGLGDEIEFATCLNDVAKVGCNVILECDPRLVNIYKRTFLTFNVRPELVKEDWYPATQDFDLQCAIGSLPKIYRRNFEAFHKEKTPLKLLDASIEGFKSRLFPYKNKKLIGICWRSGVFSIDRNLNYTSLLDWRELLTQENFQFVNLQYGDCENELIEIETTLGIQILRWPELDLKNDLENVLALIKNLDAVVTVGTAVSSLAGSCNIPTFLLSKQTWMLLGQKEYYPWYQCVIPLIAEKNEHIAMKIKLIPNIVNKSI